MKRLQYDYTMQVRYDFPVEKCFYTLKCFPTENEVQKMESMEVDMDPRSDFSQGIDSFGNRYIYGNIDCQHQSFVFHTKGVVNVDASEREEDHNGGMLGTYRYPHGLTVPGDAIKAFFSEISLQHIEHDLEKAMALMHTLYARYQYQSNITSFQTNAEEAWKMGRGVCQDYAHILIVLCRLAGIPARYVTGLLIGEGYSHAWVEVYENGYWFPLDPTHDRMVSDDYIKIGVGRDASDCLINRGVIRGMANQILDIHVSVERVFQENRE